MKKILVVLFAVLLIIPLGVGSIQPPEGFAGELWGSTFALYGSKKDVTHFYCTAEPIAKVEGGYRLLSAGHCVQDAPLDLQFSVAEETGGARTPVTMDKAYLSNTIDFALFTLKTTKNYTVFALGDEKDLRVGDITINPNFAIGIGKQLSIGIVSSLPMMESEDCPANECVGKFMVQEYAGPGASGSAVLSAKTHKVVGVLVYEFYDGSVGFAIEPISAFATFMAGPNQPHPVKEK